MEMDTVTRVQILDDPVCISQSAVLARAMNPAIPLPAQGEL